MSKFSKNIYCSVLILSFIGLNAFIIYGISSVLAYLNTGAERTSMLHTGIERRPTYLPKITWDTLQYEGRPMEKQNLKEIEKDYLNSWYVRNLAYQQNSKTGIEDYFTDSARVNIFKNMEYNSLRKTKITSTTLNHQPELNFYSADGQLVSFTDRNVISYQEVYLGEKLVDRLVDTANYKVVMLLEDGFWRIRHMVREAASGVEDSIASRDNWQIKGRHFYKRGEKFSFQGINYYPKDTPWDTFGEGFDEQTIGKDFQFLKEHGFNSIRIFIPYEEFGKADLIPEKTEKLKKLLDIAHANSLKVLITLFDFYGDYSVSDWNQTYSHARDLVKMFRNHPAVFAWDLKNEPDLDFENRGKERVLNWLKHLSDQIKAEDPEHFITIGWAKPENAHLLEDKQDFISFHFYGSPSEFKSALDSLERKTCKPLVLEEFGISTYKGVWNPFGNSEEEQANYYREMLATLKTKELSHFSWSLYDFNNIPNRVVGWLPWRKSNQKKFGLIRQDGTFKPAIQEY